MPDTPHIYDLSRTLEVRLPLAVSSKLATYRRQQFPDHTDEEVAAFLIGDGLIRVGMWEGEGDRWKEVAREIALKGVG